jgi:hypothetical protein
VRPALFRATGFFFACLGRVNEQSFARDIASPDNLNCAGRKSPNSSSSGIRPDSPRGPFDRLSIGGKTLNAHTTREFSLALPGDRRGFSCDANGAFIDGIPLLKRRTTDFGEIWERRDSELLSDELSSHYGLPIDVSSKSAGLETIAKALNANAIARAQTVALQLQFPPRPKIEQGAAWEDAAIKFIHALRSRGWLRKTWDSDEHPRWPEGAPDSQGGQFAPKDGNVGQQDAPGLTEVASNLRDGPICRDVAAAGCVAGVIATAPEGTTAGCVAAGPACPVGAAVGGTVTAVGSCIAGGILGYEACHTTVRPNSISPSNPDRPSDRATKDQCMAICSNHLGQPEGNGKWGTNEWNFRLCVEECIKEKKAYWGS